MSDQKDSSASSTSTITSLVSELLGSKSVLPGESAQEYQRALAHLIRELVAKTVMQLYLAEKMLDCLWWIRRYEDQKRLMIATHMARTLGSSLSKSESSLTPAKALELIFLDPVPAELNAVLSQLGMTILGMKVQAMSASRDALHELDRLIALQTKTLEGFQRSYEHLAHRKLHTERLALSVEMLRRDAKAIDAKVA